jgi:hypothetical protein
MERAGYLQKTRALASDSEGVVFEIIEVHIHGTRFAIRLKNLAAAIAGNASVQVEDLVHNYGYYLGATRGLGQVSASGRALNISLFHHGDFTVSLVSLRSVMYGRERIAVIVKIPGHPALPEKMRRATPGQQQICASV